MSSRVAAVPAVVMLVISLATRPAFSHGAGESDRASDLVLQAIALIVNDPGGRAAIEDKMKDALNASDKKGVDVTLVREARGAFSAGNLHRTRSLLERSIGARPHRGTGEPAPIREVGPLPKGAEPGRALPSDPLPGRKGFGSSEWAVLFGSIAIVSVGVALAIRYRPRPPRETT